MIIFGTRGVTTSAGGGQFYCPGCRATTGYSHKRVRSFFTLYFIPVIPLNVLDEYIECQGCRGTFKTEVLHMDLQNEDNDFEQLFHQTITRVMVHMMLAEGGIGEEAIETIRNIYSQLTGSQITAEQIHGGAEQEQREQNDIASVIAPCVNDLSDDGKEMLIKAAYLVAIADADLHYDEQALLERIGEAMGVSTDHLDRIIDSMQDE